jgi:hypothetical protein
MVMAQSNTLEFYNHHIDFFVNFVRQHQQKRHSELRQGLILTTEFEMQNYVTATQTMPTSLSQ